MALGAPAGTGGLARVSPGGAPVSGILPAGELPRMTPIDESTEPTPGAAPPDAASEADLAAMERAIRKAREGERKPGASPIGCVIVRDGQVLAEGHNEVGLLHDPTAHAEMVAIRRACAEQSQDDLRG